ncbi:MAG: GNAT family N-acetyltransferase [Clostridium sp.]|nr:GNAT family N-acetyltransferase [Clostridium sp.]
MSGKQWKVCELNNGQDKRLREPSLRRLWQECFGDPPEYEDYYFQNVYPGNTVYVLECEAEGREDSLPDTMLRDGGKKECFGQGDVCGMLHLNPYPCKINGVEALLHYIVGVATAKAARRQGVMRTLLLKALSGLYEAEEPFTYLMPAKERYYEPFGFVLVCAKKEWQMEVISGQAFSSLFAECDVIYMDYSSLKAVFKEDLDCLLSGIDLWLGDNYSGFASHGREYFDLLAKEKECENGAVIFCFDQAVGLENLLGFFAYGADGEDIYVEQNVLFETAEWNLTGKEEKLHALAGKEQAQKLLQGYFGNAKAWNTVHGQESGFRRRILEIHCEASYPYMVRVVHVESFLKMFADCFCGYAEKGTRLYVEEPLDFDAVDTCLSKNHKSQPRMINIYTFRRVGEKITVCRQEISQPAYDVKMTVSELADYVFGRQGKKLFFSELV